MANQPGKPIEPRKMQRAAELIGMGLSQSETAGAVGIGESTVKRILAKPEYRKLADDVRRKRTSVTAQAASVVQDLLAATNHKGEPDMASRQRGAELVMKNPELLEHVDDLEGDESMLPGVVLRFPWQPEDESENSRVSDGGEAAEGPSAPQHNPSNGLTLVSPSAESPNLPLDLDALGEPATEKPEPEPEPVEPETLIIPEPDAEHPDPLPPPSGDIPDVQPSGDIEGPTVADLFSDDLFTEADLR